MLTADPWTIGLGDGEVHRRTAFYGIVDLNGLGELAGVEILDFRRQTGATPPQSGDATLPKCGYDPEIDAFYVRVAEGNAPVQKKAKGIIALDVDNHILKLTVEALEK